MTTNKEEVLKTFAKQFQLAEEKCGALKKLISENEFVANVANQEMIVVTNAILYKQNLWQELKKYDETVAAFFRLELKTQTNFSELKDIIFTCGYFRKKRRAAFEILQATDKSVDKAESLEDYIKKHKNCYYDNTLFDQIEKEAVDRILSLKNNGN